MSDERGKVVALVPANETKSVVALLETILAMAKKGEILGIALAAHCTGNETMSSHTFEAGGNVGLLIAALERTKFRLIMKDY